MTSEHPQLCASRTRGREWDWKKQNPPRPGSVKLKEDGVWARGPLLAPFLTHVLEPGAGVGFDPRKRPTERRSDQNHFSKAARPDTWQERGPWPPGGFQEFGLSQEAVPRPQRATHSHHLRACLISRDLAWAAATAGGVQAYPARSQDKLVFCGSKGWTQGPQTDLHPQSCFILFFTLRQGLTNW